MYIAINWYMWGHMQENSTGLETAKWYTLHNSSTKSLHLPPSGGVINSETKAIWWIITGSPYHLTIWKLADQLLAVEAISWISGIP